MQNFSSQITLDALPTIVSTKANGKTKYNLTTTDFSRNSLCDFIGAEYKFGLEYYALENDKREYRTKKIMDFP